MKGEVQIENALIGFYSNLFKAYSLPRPVIEGLTRPYLDENARLKLEEPFILNEI